MELQGWVLRRCLSEVNRVCGRPYRPTDLKIRELCGVAGVTWPEPEPRSRSDLGDEGEDEEDLGEESFESEDGTDDEEIEEATEEQHPGRGPVSQTWFAWEFSWQVLLHWSLLLSEMCQRA